MLLPKFNRNDITLKNLSDSEVYYIVLKKLITMFNSIICVLKLDSFSHKLPLYLTIITNLMYLFYFIQKKEKCITHFKLS